jgi:hypothetical protein
MKPVKEVKGERKQDQKDNCYFHIPYLQIKTRALTKPDDE